MEDALTKLKVDAPCTISGVTCANSFVSSDQCPVSSFSGVVFAVKHKLKSKDLMRL